MLQTSTSYVRFNFSCQFRWTNKARYQVTPIFYFGAPVFLFVAMTASRPIHNNSRENTTSPVSHNPKNELGKHNGIVPDSFEANRTGSGSGSNNKQSRGEMSS